MKRFALVPLAALVVLVAACTDTSQITHPEPAGSPLLGGSAASAFGDPTFQSVNAGGFHSCGVTTMGAAYCWGTNFHGQLGDGKNTFINAAVAVTGGLTFQSYSTGNGWFNVFSDVFNPQRDVPKPSTLTTKRPEAPTTVVLTTPADAASKFEDGADIGTYLPAIKTVVAHGGWVFRMGNPTMKPLPAMEHVIDYAYSDVRSDWMDVFLCSQCRFMIGTAAL